MGNNYKVLVCPFCGNKAELNWHGWIGVDCTGCTCSLDYDGEFLTEE